MPAEKSQVIEPDEKTDYFIDALVATINLLEERSQIDRIIKFQIRLFSHLLERQLTQLGKAACRFIRGKHTPTGKMTIFSSNNFETKIFRQIQSNFVINSSHLYGKKCSLENSVIAHT